MATPVDRVMEIAAKILERSVVADTDRQVVMSGEDLDGTPQPLGRLEVDRLRQHDDPVLRKPLDHALAERLVQLVEVAEIPPAVQDDGCIRRYLAANAVAEIVG